MSDGIRHCPKCGKMGFSSQPGGISRGLNPYICKHCRWDVRNVYAGGQDDGFSSAPFSSMNNKSSMPFSDASGNVDFAKLSFALIKGFFQLIFAIFKIGKKAKETVDHKKAVKQRFENAISALTNTVENHDKTLWDTYANLGLFIIQTDSTVGDDDKFSGEKIGFIDTKQKLFWLFSPTDISQICGEKFSFEEAKTKATKILSYDTTWKIPLAPEAKSFRDRLLEFHNVFGTLDVEKEDVNLDVSIEKFEEYIEFALTLSRFGNHHVVGENDGKLYGFSIETSQEATALLTGKDQKFNEKSVIDKLEIEYFCAPINGGIDAEIFGMLNANSMVKFEWSNGEIVIPAPKFVSPVFDHAKVALTPHKIEPTTQTKPTNTKPANKTNTWQNTHLLKAIAGDETNKGFRDFLKVNNSYLKAKGITKRVQKEESGLIVTLSNGNQSMSFSHGELDKMMDWVDNL